MITHLLLTVLIGEEGPAPVPTPTPSSRIRATGSGSRIRTTDRRWAA